MEIICAICGTHFNADQWNAKYCSEPCRKIGKRINYENFYKRKEQLDNTTDGEREFERTCTVCKKLFISKSQRALYCSRACYKEYHSKPNIALRNQKKREEKSKTRPIYTIGKKLEDITFEQGLNYGKISYQRQIEAMRKGAKKCL